METIKQYRERRARNSSVAEPQIEVDVSARLESLMPETIPKTGEAVLILAEGHRSSLAINSIIVPSTE